MPFSALRILVIDDDEDDFVILRELFGEIGYPSARVEWARGWSEGFESMKEGRHDVYLVDYRLGARTGIELLREAIAAGVHQPILLLTGQGDREVDLEAMKVGAADYLVKGDITPQLLERSIRYSIFHAQSLQELRHRERNFRDLFNSGFEGVFIHALSAARIMDANAPAARMLGYSREELVGRDLTDFILPMRREETLMALQGGREVTAHETQARRKDGTAIWLELSSRDYVLNGEKVRLTSMRDISARRQMEAQIILQDRLASIGLLASSLAHEIGNPLGVIRGRAEFIQMRARDDEQIRKYAEVIYSQIDRVSRLIRSLLKLARGEHVAVTSDVALHQVVGEVTELIAHEAQKKGVQLENLVPPGVQVAVRAEAQPLHQVVLNLVINAIHAIESEIARGGRASGHMIRVSVEDAGGSWALCIEDTGTGISPEHLSQLFKPFFTTKDVGQGTGLGLATSYRIVESWGGSIEVKSKVGVGTTFRILLPKTAEASESERRFGVSKAPD